MITPPIVEVNNLYKSFKVGPQWIKILNGITFEVPSGDFLIIFGPSGCGKSTLLHSIIGLEEPTKGTVKIFGHDMYSNTDEDARSEMRKKLIGMVYQQPNWIHSINVIENVAFPLVLMGYDTSRALSKAEKLLRDIKMEEWANHSPYELSSGQQQKIAVSRALITEPQLFIADEPTGNLDYESGNELMRLLTQLNRDYKKTILMVTHDLEYLKYSKHFIRMLNGSIDKRLSKDEDKEKIYNESLKVTI